MSVLAARGARILLGCRSEEKAKAAMDTIRRDHPNADLAWIPLDLASLKSVEAAAQIRKRDLFRALVLSPLAR